MSDDRIPLQRKINAQQYQAGHKLLPSEFTRLHNAMAQLTRERNEALERLAAAEAMLDCRAGKLLRKGRTFIVVAVDEPYFLDMFSVIRKQQRNRGTWSENDEEWYLAARQEWINLQETKASGRGDALGEAARAAGGK